MTIRLSKDRQRSLARIATRLHYKTITAYAIARLFAPLGAVGLAALRRILVDVARIETRVLDGEPVHGDVAVLRARIETYLRTGFDELFPEDPLCPP